MGTSRTYATFRMFEDDLDPDAVTTELGIAPTTSFRRGDRRPTAPTLYPQGGWLLSTSSDDPDGPGASRDVRVHVDQLLDALEQLAEAVARFVATGARCDVFCFWETDNGQGGPQLDPSQMGRLAALGLPIGFDCYNIRRHWDGETSLLEG